MASDGAVPFLEMFPFCRTGGELGEILSGGEVLEGRIDRAGRAMNMRARFTRYVPQTYLSAAESMIKDEYGLKSAVINAEYPEDNTKGERVRPAPPAPADPPSPDRNRTGKSSRRESGQSGGEKTIFGKMTGDPVTPISDVTLESGKVTVRGHIFAVSSREVRGGAYILSFDMTDGTDSIRVSKFITDGAVKTAAMGISEGMDVTVCGTVSFSRYDNDTVIDPKAVAPAPPREHRRDSAPEKRVELHLHTKMSTMDAVTDTGEAVKRAIEWGHRAVAITDHGVCQSFPDAMKAAGDKIKIIYGVEGYYFNDVDDRLAVTGERDFVFPGEYVAFDIETTGLSSRRDRIIEIGAVLFRNGEEAGRYQTFADPGRRVPPDITQLTGITDAMIAGAPSEEDAVRGFLEFAGGRPFAAHNAAFDTGFIEEACGRMGLDFTPTYLDTMVLAQTMMPELKNHKLDTVATALALPDFEHHRASDDALTCGLIAEELLSRLSVMSGVSSLSGVNAALSEISGPRPIPRRQRLQHITVIARTQKGLKNLYKLVSKSHLEHLKRYPTMPKSLLMEYREGLIIGSACQAGEVFQSVVDNRSRSEQRRLAGFYDYLEIQPICNNMFMLDGDKPKASGEEELRDFNRRILELGDELGKPVVATGDVHFLDPEDEVYRRVLLSAREYEDADRELPLYFRTTDEMLEEFSYLGDRAYEVVVTNTNLIADMCDTIRPLPPAGKLYAPTIENSDVELKNLVYDRMHELYGETPPPQVQDRVDTELNTILEHKYDVIYMSAQKLVKNSMDHGYLVGSRGSVGSSVVAFLAGITEVNALPPHYRCPRCRHSEFITDGSYGCGADMPDRICPVCGAEYEKDGFNIPFETFLGFPGNEKTPDIDLNFSGEFQAEAHRYTNELFGADHVFRAGTIGTVAEKTAYGYVKKYLERTGRTVRKAEESRLALGCVGVKRTTGQHPGGLVIVPQNMEIEDFCPVQRPADDEGTDVITTHFEYHCIDDNLLKMDELGHDNPTMIKMMEDMTGVDAKKIPLDDPETLGIFTSTEPLGLPDDDPIIGKTGTIGIPEFGTGFTRQMLVDAKPDSFNSLLRLSGFSHGTDVWLGNAKDLIMSGTATVNETVGCRDDIMLYLISKGMESKTSFKIMEAVRKGKVKKNGFEPGWEDTMREHEVPDWYIESLSKIAYLFPKAHAAAYVIMAFRIAWFKVHRPLEFYSAYFYRRSQKDSFDISMMGMGEDTVKKHIRNIKNNPDPSAKDEELLTTLEACWEFYRRGYTFERLDLYESDATKFLLTENGLRPPFVAVPGLGEAAALDLASHRDGREFVSVEELSASCPKVSRAHIEQLRALGALGDLPDTSQVTFF